MSGVSVDQARPPSQTDIDMALAYEGGGNFMSRLTQLSDLKQRHDEALAELNLGQTAKAALADAQSKQIESGSKFDEANRALAQAEQTAAEVVRAANDRAKEILKNADDAAAATINEADVKRANADQYAKDKKKSADKSLKDARAIEEEADATRSELSAALVAANAEKASHEDAKAKADALATALQAKIDALHIAIDEVRHE